MLDDLTKPDFIREDEEFQELLQYLIITIIKAGQCFLIHGIPHHLVKREYQG